MKYHVTHCLDDAGETIEDLEDQDNQAKLGTTLKQWMRAKIKQIVDRRGAQVTTSTRTGVWHS